jgi:cytochrome o ubiquinol oxidase subunit 3
MVADTLQNHDAHHHDNSGTNNALFGFWLYIMTDCILFATLFTVFIVLSKVFPGYSFDMNLVMTETIILLTSSFTMGLAIIYMHKKQQKALLLFLFITFLLGASFIFLEIKEFIHLIHEGNSFTKNAYFSSFFALVSTHGLHVTVGLLWIALLFIQIIIRGITALNTKKLLLLSLFWHFLDIIWIFVFSIVYLIGGGV